MEYFQISQDKQMPYIIFVQITLQIFNLNKINRMDPRPYTYEYRKPRLSNPTYQSPSLYDSIYHLQQYSGSKRFTDSERVDKVHNKSNYMPYQLPQTEKQMEARNGISSRRQEQQQENGYSQQLAKSSFVQPTNVYPKHNAMYQSNLYEQTKSKLSSNPGNRSFSQDSHKYGSFSNYGQRIMQPFAPGRDQDYVYEKQNSNFNIISCHPNEHSSVHRKYPKYTLENRLFQTGQYKPNPEYD